MTRDEALAWRPRLDDPTRLENGQLHPAYVEWTVRNIKEGRDEFPYRTFVDNRLTADDELLVDKAGYFDRALVKKRLGKNGPGMLVLGTPLPSPKRSAVVAELLGVAVDELDAAIEAEREMRRDRETMIARCQWFPCLQMSFDRLVSGTPCPGCGRPWTESGAEIEHDPFDAEHSECKAGLHSCGAGPNHCCRCCGFPPIDPAKLEQISAMVSAATERHRRDEAEAKAREKRATRSEDRAAARARRIEKLEAELDQLRGMEQDDPEA